ncbi:MAG TPA: hypothetical protein VMB35_09690 [Methanomicrobiales archaeon]|nr:hypothetical protein [Methanomicrobiales archaeon]
MTRRIFILLSLALVALALAPGCTMPPAGGGGTPTPTMTTAAPAPGATVPPGPVVTVPPAYEVIIQVTRDPNTAFPYINFAFRGGKGQYILQRITVTVARSDGIVVQEVIPKSGQNQYAVGDSVRITGTTGTDEVVVVVTILGQDYKIYDENMPFYTIPPPPP